MGRKKKINTLEELEEKKNRRNEYIREYMNKKYQEKLKYDDSYMKKQSLKAINYYNNNKSNISINQKKYHQKNKEKISNMRKNYYQKNKEHILEYQKSWRKENKKITYEKNKDYQKNRKHKDPLYKMKCNMRSLISISMKQKGFKKTAKAHMILGCSYEEFKIWIENRFMEGMTWENYGMWEYDHIIPISSATSEEDVIRLNHYTNFQPLWEPDNKKKYNKIL